MKLALIVLNLVAVSWGFAATATPPTPSPTPSAQPGAAAQQVAPDTAKPAYERFKVQFVTLEAAPNVPEAAADDPRREQHLKGLEAMVRSRQALIAGPLADGGAIQGIVVLDVETKAEAEKLLAKDPWVAAGQLIPKYHTWYVAKKLFQPLTGSFLDLEQCTLGLLVRPDDAPTLTPEESSTVQAGHMANIMAMHEAGELAIAGPFVEDTPLRGIFVFRTTDRAKIDAMVANDAAIKRGRVKMQPYTWMVSKGLLPAR